MVEEVPVSGFDKFRATPAAKVIGIILAIAVAVLLFYIGLFSMGCCGLGILLTAILVFIVLKIFKVDKVKTLIIVGVIMFVVTTAIGGFVVSKDYVKEQSVTDSSVGFHDMVFTYENGELTATVSYDGTANLKEVNLYFGEVSYICYRSYNYYGSTGGDGYTHAMTQSGNTYSCTFGAAGERFYGYKIVAKTDADATISTSDRICLACINESQYDIELIKLNAYYCGLAAIIFLAIIAFTEISKKNLEKNKQKMIGEGKLPAGYGMCKNCGGLIVPGEQFCRKCGKKIEGVDPMPAKQTETQDTFECSDCGAKVPADAKVCPKCGAKFDE